VFFQPDRTQFDLNWTMFGVHVRVHPLFWLVTAVLGWDLVQLGLGYFLLWVGSVFVSVLIHELGHVFMGRWFGADGHIILYGMGGLAVGSSALSNRWQRIAVYFAGPFAELLILGLAWWGFNSVEDQEISPLARAVIKYLFWFNLFWVFMNLVPIWPLDGGQISREFLDWWMPEKGVRVALGLSLVFAGLLALNALTVTTSGRALPLFDLIPYLNQLGGFITVLFFASFAVNSYLALQHESRRRPWEHERDYWDR
jgi:Zn-dependent protease